jgi:hypothetical protein
MDGLSMRDNGTFIVPPDTSNLPAGISLATSTGSQYYPWITVCRFRTFGKHAK